MKKIISILIVIVILLSIIFSLKKNSSETEYLLDNTFISEYFGLSFNLPQGVSVKSIGLGADQNQVTYSNYIEINPYDVDKIVPAQRYNGSVVNQFTIVDITNHPGNIDKSLEDIVKSEHRNSSRNSNFETTELKEVSFKGFPAYSFSHINSDEVFNRNIFYIQKENMIINITYSSDYLLFQEIFDSIEFIK